MPKLTIDGLEIEVPAGSTVLQACEAAGKEITKIERQLKARDKRNEATLEELRLMTAERDAVIAERDTLAGEAEQLRHIARAVERTSHELAGVAGKAADGGDEAS